MLIVTIEKSHEKKNPKNETQCARSSQFIAAAVKKRRRTGFRAANTRGGDSGGEKNLRPKRRETLETDQRRWAPRAYELTYDNLTRRNKCTFLVKLSKTPGTDLAWRVLENTK